MRKKVGGKEEHSGDVQPVGCLVIIGGSRLSWIFWEHENLSGLSVICLTDTKINIKLYKN